MIRLISLSAKGFKQLDIDELKFPEKGTVLVVGRNEAGKSTLFEAIYFALFGEGLVPSRGPKSLPDLLGYRREKGFVSLKFSVAESVFEVVRILKRKGSNEHRLKVLSPRQESITGARAVNERIERELKLDGDALLNSCFVEQKNLEKLENLKADERQRSIARLLNIENFKMMEDDFKDEIKKLEEDETRDGQRLELAIMLDEIPLVEKEKTNIEHRLMLLDMKRERRELTGKIMEGEERSISIKTDINGLISQKNEIEALEKKLPSKEKRFESLAELKASLQTYNGLIDVMRGEKTELTGILSNIEHAREIQKKNEELQSLVECSRLAIKKKEVGKKDVEKIVTLFRHKSLLSGWEAAKKSEDEIAVIDMREDEIEKNRRVHEKERNDRLLKKGANELRVTGVLLCSIIFFMLALIFFVWGTIKSLSYAQIMGVILSLIALAGFIFVYLPWRRQLSTLKVVIGKIEGLLKEGEEELLRLEGERRLLKTRGRIEFIPSGDIEREIKENGFTVPSSLQDCMRIQKSLNDRLSMFDEKEMTEKLREMSDDILSFVSSIDTNEKMMRTFQTDMKKYDLPQLEARKEALMAETDKKKTRAKEILLTCQRKAEGLGIQAEYDTVMTEHSRLSEEISGDRKLLPKKEGLQKDVDLKNGELLRVSSQIRKYEERAEEIDLTLKNDEQAKGLDLTQEADLKKDKEILVGNLARKKGKADELKSILGVTQVEKSECEKKLAQTKRTLSVTNVARDIVTRARKQIEANVLPRIEDNMEKFIPLLTADRYKEVLINPQDYRIEVMDEFAGERRPKSVFSGGTRDQFSLALRLSFALATLPEERGSSPSFIFLDEPIGAFDEERRNALIELLTIGEISDSFDQIFIISHFSELEDVFEYRIKMDGGRVVDTNL